MPRKKKILVTNEDDFAEVPVEEEKPEKKKKSKKVKKPAKPVNKKGQLYTWD